MFNFLGFFWLRGVVFSFSAKLVVLSARSTALDSGSLRLWTYPKWTIVVLFFRLIYFPVFFFVVTPPCALTVNLRDGCFMIEVFEFSIYVVRTSLMFRRVLFY